MNALEECPRAKTGMTPCVRRDRYAADNDRYCVGCGEEASPRGWLGRHDPPEPSVTRLDAMPSLPVAWFLRAEPGEEER